MEFFPLDSLPQLYLWDEGLHPNSAKCTHVVCYMLCIWRNETFFTSQSSPIESLQNYRSLCLYIKHMYVYKMWIELHGCWIRGRRGTQSATGITQCNIKAFSKGWVLNELSRLSDPTSSEGVIETLTKSVGFRRLTSLHSPRPIQGPLQYEGYTETHRLE